MIGSATGESLAAYRWHTGAEVRPLEADCRLPMLFRDVGPMAIACFLRRGLKRLAGPMTPITYLRTADYTEPYLDHGRIGRLVLLRPLELSPWHAGIPTIFVAKAERMPAPSALAYAPGHLPLKTVEALAGEARESLEYREALGGVEYDDAVEDGLLRIDDLVREHDRAEILARPLRRQLQSGTMSSRARARQRMRDLGIDEADLCAAWHHLPESRRRYLAAALEEWGDG